MAFQRMQDMDAYILMEFRKNVKHLMGRPKDASWMLEMKKTAQPFFDRLLRNGHDRRDAAGLLQSAFNLPA
jgi:hypothetical protein